MSVAIIQPQLHAPHLPVGNAIGRPCTKASDSTNLGGEIGQVLQSNAFTILCMAGGTGEIVGSRAKVKQLFAQVEHAFLFSMGLGYVEAQTFRLGRHPCGQGGYGGLLSLAVRRFADLFGIKTLQGFHTEQ